jgi:adenine-specific DNA-methyltransferase
MPTLQFKGKNIIWNHHLAIPYHTLDETEKLHFQPEKADGNLLIEGDNLLALKALLPQYAGKIKCIYIDPPYNTGNDSGQGKGWIYNDNVNSPLLKEWLKTEVGKDDLTRHDKWLCMMVPRLKLLREFLANDGVIFISIDDNEIHRLREILDEIYGESNFIQILVWEKKKKGTYLSNSITNIKEYVVVYARDISQFPGLIGEINKAEETYPCINASNRREVRKIPAGIISKFREKNYTLKKGKRISVETMDLLLHSDLVIVNGILSKELIIEGNWRYTQDLMEEYASIGELYITQDLYLRRIVKEPRSKTLKDLLPRVGDDAEALVKGININNLFEDGWGSNEDAEQELRQLMGVKSMLEYPKPKKLIEKLLASYREKNIIVLDSFAGSGTTMHAVMDLNKEDGGNRKCILVQMTEATKEDPKKNICKDITRERVKRAIEKYSYDAGFKYYKIGIPLDAETLLSGKLPSFKQFAEYVYYLCTGESLKEKAAVNEKNYFVGEFGNYVIYLVYKQDFEALTKTALNLDLAEKLIETHPKKRIIVYAPACFLEEDYMNEKNIDYVGIPYNLFQRSGA